MDAVSIAGSGLFALLLDAAVKGFVLMMVASLLVFSLKWASAATRHLVWSVAVCGLLVLPVVSVFAPKWTVPGVEFKSTSNRPEEVVSAQVTVADVAVMAEGAGEGEEGGEGVGVASVARELRTGIGARGNVRVVAPVVEARATGQTIASTTPSPSVEQSVPIPHSAPAVTSKTKSAANWMLVLRLVCLAGAGL